MGRTHQSIAQQMKGELEEPLAALGGGLKERRKIVQNSIEKLLKAKTQQTQAVNKVSRVNPYYASNAADRFSRETALSRIA